MKQTWKAKDEVSRAVITASPYESPFISKRSGVLFHVAGDVSHVADGVLVPYDKALKLHRRLGEWLDEAAPDEAEVVG